MAKPYDFTLRADEAVVLAAWLEREAGRNAGANIAAAAVDGSEPVSLRLFAAEAVLSGVTAALGSSWRGHVAPSRAKLEPAETLFEIDCSGTEAPEATASGGDAPPDADIEFTWTNGGMLVVFEFLCREIEAAEGARLGGSFVSSAEFWALNALQCVLEARDSFYAAARPYAEQVGEARLWMGRFGEDAN